MIDDADSGASWDTWFQGVAGNVLDKWSSATYQQPYEIQKLKIAALGEQGYYNEGLPTARANGGGLGISSGTLLLAGAALVVVLMLKD